MADNYNSLYTGPEIDASVGKVLTTQDAWDGAVAAQLPAGGTEGQILVKTGAADYATGWKTPVLVRPNLLDNWYFGDGVVNQRRQSVYTSQHYIDRWRSNYASGGNTVTLYDGYIKIACGASARMFSQPITRYIPPGTYTISALINAYSGSCSFAAANLTTVIDGSRTIDATGLLWKTITVSDSDTVNRFRILLTANAQVDVVAVKLEAGDTQTLAHQENGVWVLNELPDPGEELLKCQRYLQVFRTQALRPTYAEDFRPVMAADPTLGSFDINGVTYYTASAEP